ncbi:MAG: ABC transporter substrate-binding protein [Actinomycetota bacterium]|nr:ABC transporter substrate-binding protein [Actinomycetota bacterium]
MTPSARTAGPRPRVAAAILALALGAAACGSDGDDNADADARSETSGPESGSGSGSSEAPTLTIATSFGIDDLDPLANSFWGPEFGYVELLMRPERDGRPTPWVLESLTNVDETTWELGLRDDVVFDNGTALDAEALVELIGYMNEHNEGFAAALDLDAVEVTDDSTLTLTTTAPVPNLANVFADESNLPVFDVAAYEEFLASGDDPAALIDLGLYTGPYTMTSLDDQTAELVPVDDYWDGPPALSALTIKFVPEATSRIQAVQNGEADIALYVPTDAGTTLEGRDDAFYVTGEPTGTTFSVQLRNAGPWAETDVRRALFAAIDYRELATDVMDGRASIATSVFADSFPYAVDTQETDLDLAAELLEGAGWTGDGGTRTRDGEPLTLRLLSYPQQPDSNTIAIAIQAQLADVGIDVEVSDVPDLTEAREGDDWDAAIVGDSLLSFALSPEDGLRSDLVTGGDQNYMGVSNDELDDLVETLSATFDEGERNELLGQIQQVIHDNGLWAATIMRQPAVVTNAEWRGYETPVANLWVTASTAPTS